VRRLKCLSTVLSTVLSTAFQLLNEAAIEGAKLRFRPIQMTSFAFIAGLLPLVAATGPGAIGNRTIGTAAAGGMLMGTLIGVLIIPGLYYLFGVIADKRHLIKTETREPLSEIFEHADEPLSEILEHAAIAAHV
jgi:HAE1 family hydrophobic/amphiphilic exporter-1